MCAPTEIRATVINDKNDRDTKHSPIPQVFLGKDGVYRYKDGRIANDIDTESSLFLPVGKEPTKETLELVGAKHIRQNGRFFFPRRVRDN